MEISAESTHVKFTPSPAEVCSALPSCSSPDHPLMGRLALLWTPTSTEAVLPFKSFTLHGLQCPGTLPAEGQQLLQDHSLLHQGRQSCQFHKTEAFLFLAVHVTGAAALLMNWCSPPTGPLLSLQVIPASAADGSTNDHVDASTQ